MAKSLTDEYLALRNKRLGIKDDEEEKKAAQAASSSQKTTTSAAKSGAEKQTEEYLARRAARTTEKFRTSAEVTMNKGYPASDDDDDSMWERMKNAAQSMFTPSSDRDEEEDDKTSLWEHMGLVAGKGLSDFNKGVTSTLALLEKPVQAVFPGAATPLTDIAEHYAGVNDYYTQRLEESRADRSRVGQIATDVGVGTVSALPNAILALMSGGTSMAAQGSAALGTAASSGLAASVGTAAKEMAKNPMYWTSVLQTLGPDFEEAKANGASDLEASASAIISSALNAGVEIGGGLEVLPERLKRGGSSAIYQWVKGALEEGQEEVVQSVISGITQKGTYDADKAWFSTEDQEAVINPMRLAEEGLMGAAVGGILGGGQIGALSAANAVANRVNDRRMGNVGAEYQVAAEEVVNEGLSFAPETEAYQTAQTLKSKMDAGETVTDAELGWQVYENERAIRQEESLARANSEPSDELLNAAREVVAQETKSSPAAPVAEAEADAEPVSYRNVLNQTRKTAKPFNPGYGEYGTKAFNEILESEQSDPVELQSRFQSAYEAGLTDVPVKQIHLETDVQQMAFNAGKQDYIMRMKTTESPYAAVYGKKGGFIETDASRDVDRTTVDTLNTVGKALGIKIRYESSVYGGMANGSYADGIVTIARDADNPDMVVAKHEITHHLEKAAPKQYMAYRNYAVQIASAARGMTGTTLVEDYQNRAANAGVSLSTEQAMDEIAADFTERILTDDKALGDFVRDMNQTKENRTVAQKFFEAVRNFIDKVKRVFKGNKSKMDAAAVEQFGATVVQLEKAEKLWKEAYRAGAEYAQNASETTTKREGKLIRTTDADGTSVLTTSVDNPVMMTDENGSAQLSLKTYEAFGRAELKRWLDLRVSKKQLTSEEAADIVKQLDDHYELLQKFKDKYAPFGAWSDASVVTDNKGKPVFSVVKANGEYAMNLDFSLVCKKRRTLDAVFKEMIQRGIMDNLSLEEADIAKVNEIIRESGFETACALCFVDSKRYRQAKVADTFVSQYNDIVKLLIPEDGSVKAHYFDFVGTGLRKTDGVGLHTLSNAQLQPGIEQLKQIMRENGKQTVAHKIAKHLLNTPKDRRLVSRSDFMNTDGFGAVKLKNPAILKLYNSSKGAGGPKAAFSDVQYLGEILKKNNFTPARAYAVGGVRIQSFSDYIPRLVFDYMQMVADLAAKKLPAHAYTKEAIFVKQFGMTGIKMNMSLVPAVAEDGIAPGLDKNGDYFWFDGQSFGSDVKVKGSGKTGFDLAVQIQNTPGYSQHCGTIAVGVSNQHIEKMLDDENIRMIIPYHKSSLNHIVAVMNNIDKYTDYTKVQNTRKADGTKISGKDFNYNEALLRTGDAKAAANEYLAWCEEHDYIPKFDDFAGHENYYKVLEDFSTYDNGEAAPQGAVTLTLPKEGDAFGSMADLIEEGLEEDALLEASREKSVPAIVDKVESVLKKRGESNTFVNPNTGENVQYSLRTKEPPKKTIIAYKAFYAHDGKLYPPMVSNPSDTTSKVSGKVKKELSGTVGGQETPVGVWLDADVGGIGVDKDGNVLRTDKTGRIRVQNDQGGGTLAFRPGWHLGEWPDAKQFNRGPLVPYTNYKGEQASRRVLMPDGIVFAKCEIAADVDYQLEAMEYGMNEKTDKKGKVKRSFSRSQAGLPRVPEDGYYKYRTNVDPTTAPWYITGAMRVVEILDDDDCARICAEFGVVPDKRVSGKKINLADYGLKRGPVTPTEDVDRFKKSQRNIDNEALLEKALNDPEYADAYRPGILDFDNPEIRKEFEINKQDPEYYRKEYEKQGKQYSLKDSEYLDAVINDDTKTAQKLVDEAAEAAMPDSKIRSKNGKLLPVYHGTNNSFNVFDTKFSGGKNGTAEGYGIYTSDNPEVTAAYGTRQLKMYANITKPAMSNKKTIKAPTLAKLIKDTCQRQAMDMVAEGDYDSEKDALFDTWISNYVYTYDLGMERSYREAAAEILRMNDSDMAIIQEVMSGMGIRDYLSAMAFYEESLTPITGFDGFWTQWDNAETGKKSNIILAFNSNQLKLAEPVTRDDNGDAIPLSERFNQESQDIRYSMKDKDYMAAVERGDMVAAQKMVDEVAKEAGYSVKAYHGTDNEFNTFGRNRIKSNTGVSFYGNGFYFSTSKSDASNYGNIVKPVYLRAEKVLDLDSDTWSYELGLEDKKEAIHVEKTSIEQARNGFLNVHYTTKDNPQKWESFSHVSPAQLMDDETGKKFVERKLNPSSSILPRDVKNLGELAKQKGFDAIKGAGSNVGDLGTEYVVFSGSQIKSADPVTRDDNGDVIPLSERFNADSDDIRFSLKAQNDLMRENAKLKETVETLREQFKTTKFAQVDRKSLDRFTKKLLQDYSSGADINETRDSLGELYTYIANGENGEAPVWNEAYKRAYETAVGILEASSELNDDMYQEYKHLRNQLKNTGITISPEYDHDLMGYESINDFRKANFGRIKLVKNGTPVDIAYQDLANTYPELFDDMLYTTQPDQLSHIEEVLNRMQPVEVNRYSHDMREHATWLANDILERFYELPQAKPTFADKAEQKLTKQVIKDTKKLERVRLQKNERIKQLIETNREKIKKVRSDERTKRDAAIKEIKEHYKAKEGRASESRKVRELRAKILRHTTELSKKLLRASDRNHIPQELQGPVAKLLECINMESNYTYDSQSDSYKKNDLGSPTLRTRLFANLRKIYANLADELTVDPDLLGEDGLLTDVVELADKRMADMTYGELETIWKAIRAIEASIQSANIAFNQQRFATISEWAEALRMDNFNKKEKVELDGPFGILGKGQKLTGLDMMTPEAYFHRLGKSGDGLFRLMRDAQDDHIRKMKEVSDFTRKALKGVDVKKLESKMHTVKLGGKELQMSTAQIMELYVLMRREQAREHIMIGGILPDVVSKGKMKKVSRAKPVRGVQPSELFKAFDLLTEDQKKVAETLQAYASGQLSKWGNEAAMKVYNYEKFGEKTYWPIRVNRQETNSSVQKDTQVTSVAGRGFTKGTKPHANNSVMIGSIFDTFSTHASEMATYAAWLAPMEDINRIRNFTFKSEGQTVDTVKGIIDTVHGKQGTAYLSKLLADLSNGVKGTHGETAYMSALVGNYKAASVGANLRVIIQQPTAILRAMDMLGPQYLVAGVRPANGWKKAKKYAPIAQWKDWGYFDINTGRQMKDVLFDSDSALNKVRNASMAGAGFADSLSWGILWNAVETETRHKRKDLKDGSEEFYQAAAERFNEIVDHTQVVDGILQRSQIMRSADGLTKMATSFMGEPTKQYNMMMSAAYDASHGTKDQRKAGKKKFARAAFALAVSSVANAMAQAVMDAVRDDDKEKEYWDKWLAALTGLTGDEETTWDKAKNFMMEGNLGNTLNPAGYIPFVKDVFSLLQGYDVSRMDMESIEKTMSASQNMLKALNGEGKYTIGAASANLFAEVSRMLGIPVANLKREVKSFAMLSAVETDNYLMQYRMEKASLALNYSGNSSTFLDILFNAYQHDQEAYDIIYADMVSSGFDKEKLQNGMESRMKKSEGVKSVSDLDQRFLHPDQQPEYDRSMNAIKRSGFWSGATEKQRNKVEEKLYDLVTDSKSGEKLQEKIDEGRAYGLDETEYLLYTLALDMNDQPDEDGDLGSYTSKEKAAAITSIGVGNSEMAFLWDTDQGYEAHEYGISMDKYIEFKANVGDIKADKNSAGKTVSGSRKKKIIEYLNDLGLTYEEYLYLLGTEYDTTKKSADYKRYFGG